MRRRLKSNQPLVPNTVTFTPAHQYHVDDFQVENTMMAAQDDPSLAKKYHDFHMGEHDTERVGIEKVESNADTQLIHSQEQPLHLIPSHSIGYLTHEIELLNKNFKKLLDENYRRRTFVDMPVVVSANTSFILDYSQRLNLYIFSPQKTILLSISDGSSITVYPDTWTNLSGPRGGIVTAPQISDAQPVWLTLRAVDELFSDYVTTPVIQSTGYTSVPTGAGNTVVKNGPGQLSTIVVNTAGATGFTVFDSPTTNAGQILYTSKGAPALGDIYQILGVAKTGITVQNTATGPVLLVYFE